MTWHDGSIPAEKVYLKLGGDHGQGSMKMEFQIANVPKPNSPQNTVVFALFEGKDTRNNLATILDGYREQVKDLNSTTWRYAHILFSEILSISSSTDILLSFFTGVRHLFVFCMVTTNFCVKSWGFLEHLVSKCFDKN